MQNYRPSFRHLKGLSNLYVEMDKSQIVELDCGHVYSRATWKADSTCWFCEDIESGKNVSSKGARQRQHLLATIKKARAKIGVQVSENERIGRVV